MLSEKKSEQTLKKEENKEAQSPEENWDDIVNRDILNYASDKKNSNDNMENEIYDNLSKLNKDFIFNSDSKLPLNKSEELQNKKKVKFDYGKENNYYNKLKSK